MSAGIRDRRDDFSGHMKTLVVNNEKGGVGKSTIAVHLAWYFAERGNRVLFLDLDPQSNGTTTLAAHAGEIDAAALFVRPIAIPPMASVGIRALAAPLRCARRDLSPCGREKQKDVALRLGKYKSYIAMYASVAQMAPVLRERLATSPIRAVYDCIMLGADRSDSVQHRHSRGTATQSWLCSRAPGI